jgi:hypothetical protein
LGATLRNSSGKPPYGLSLVVGSPLGEDIRVVMFSCRLDLAVVSILVLVSIVCCFDLCASEFISMVCCSDLPNLSLRNSINSCGLLLKSQIKSLIS